MERPVAVLDACVLYPAPLRDLMLHLALVDLFQAKWTDAIHEEWITNLLDNRPDLTRAALERTRDLMNSHVRDCLVDGYESRIPALTLPDPDDRHVLAAAIHCEADTIVTFNLSDFPAGILDQWGIQTRHPDEFVSEFLAYAPDIVCTAVRRQRENLKNPPKNVAELLNVLYRQGLTEAIAMLEPFRERL